MAGVSNASMRKSVLRDHGFCRVAVSSLETKVADVDFNCQEIEATLDLVSTKGVDLIVFPELCITGYSCGDLFYQQTLLEQARRALVRLAAKTKASSQAVIVGLPLLEQGKIFNCAACLVDGEILGIVPKINIPNSGEYYEKRWFASGNIVPDRGHLILDGNQVPFGTDLLFHLSNLEHCTIGIEICEDLWTTRPPSSDQVAAGASLIANLSASNEVLGKAEYRKQLVIQQSARCIAGYAYASAGPGESTTDLVFGGHCLLSENGSLLDESNRFEFQTQLIIRDMDLQRLRFERAQNSSFNGEAAPRAFRTIEAALPEADTSVDPLLREVLPLPFVPDAGPQREQHCEELFSIQATGLAKRMKHTGLQKAVIGISGGLDSTLALLVTAQAFDKVGLPRSDIIGISMPGFGTSKRTKRNAEALITAIGATSEEIPIGDAVTRHLADIGQQRDQDVTFENAQARERTQILMDMANAVGGLVVGTGDLSEAALGWCTYNGDHMSMYHVNAGVPKTLVKTVIQWFASTLMGASTGSELLIDICDTPISPELLPPTEGGEISQHTEEIVGPYRLHDFFLFQVVRNRFPPEKIIFLAKVAFGAEYDEDEIKHWLINFYRRFFEQQFKRSAMPDGPKVGSVALSQRGDWRMPSDASVQIWLDRAILA